MKPNVKICQSDRTNIVTLKKYLDRDWSMGNLFRNEIRLSIGAERKQGKFSPTSCLQSVAIFSSLKGC